MVILGGWACSYRRGTPVLWWRHSCCERQRSLAVGIQPSLFLSLEPFLSRGGPVPETVLTARVSRLLSQGCCAWRCFCCRWSLKQNMRAGGDLVVLLSYIQETTTPKTVRVLECRVLVAEITLYLEPHAVGAIGALMNIVLQPRTLECPWTQRRDGHCCGSRRAFSAWVPLSAWVRTFRSFRF